MPSKGVGVRIKDVKLGLETAKEALTGIGIPGVEPIACIPLLILKNYEAVGTDKAAMSQLLESLESLKSVIYNPVVAKAGKHGAVPEDLFQRVEQLKCKLEGLEAILTPFIRMSSLKRFRERDHIATALADVNRGVAQAIRDFQLTSQIAADLQAAEARKRSNLDLLKYAAGSSWNPTRICLAGTRVDLIEELVNAATRIGASSPHRIHIVVGVAGCGKSTLAHSIARACAESTPPTLAATFFFNRGVDQRNTQGLLFSSMAHDLSKFYPAAANAINDVLDSDRNILSQSLTEQFEKLFLFPIASIPDSQPVVVVIDALDEGLYDGLHDTFSDPREKCDEAVRIRKELIGIFSRKCAQLPPNSHIVITSRPEAQIMQIGRSSHVCIEEVDLNDSRNKDDIERFATHSLRGIADERCLGATWPGGVLIGAYTQKAEGLYIWVSTTAAFIARATNPLKQLQHLCGDRSSFNLEPEAKMAQLYNTVLAACPWDDDDFTDNFQLLMGTILTLKTPLSPLATKSLLGIDISIVDTLRPLSPVLTGVTDTEDGDRPLQIVHDSFRGYFTGRDKLTLSKDELRYVIDQSEHGQNLVLIVLRLLNRELPIVKPIIDDITTAISSQGAGDIPLPPAGSVSEPLWYCCQYLLPHLTEVLVVNDDLIEALYEFVERNILLWIVLCSSEGALQGVSAIFALCKRSSLNLPSSDLEPIAGMFYNLGTDVGYMGRLEEALLAGQESVDLYRQLASDYPVFTPVLANAAQNLSVGLSELGHHDAALAASREAELLFRQAIKEHPDMYTAALAKSLHCTSIDHLNLGKHDEALAASRESVDLYRQLVQNQPNMFDSDFANSLFNQSVILSHLRQYEEALATNREATDLHRQLGQTQPLMNTLHLAESLDSLSVNLLGLGHYEEALAASREAIVLRRQLAKDRPKVHTSALAYSLHGLSAALSKLGDHGEALAASREAVHIRRELAKDRPLAFTSKLAVSLQGLSVHEANVGHHDDALSAMREAVSLYRQGPMALTNYAPALYNLSVQLSNLGHKEEALSTGQEAVKVFRQLVEGQPTVHTPDLANSLKTLAVYHSNLDRHQETLDASREASDLYRQLVKARPRVFNDKLAEALEQLVECLDFMDCDDEAAGIREELRALQERALDSEV